MGVKGSLSTPWPHLPRFVIMSTEDWSCGIDREISPRTALTASALSGPSANPLLWRLSACP